MGAMADAALATAVAQLQLHYDAQKAMLQQQAQLEKEACDRRIDGQMMQTPQNSLRNSYGFTPVNDAQRARWQASVQQQAQAEKNAQRELVDAQLSAAENNLSMQFNEQKARLDNLATTNNSTVDEGTTLRTYNGRLYVNVTTPPFFCPPPSMYRMPDEQEDEQQEQQPQEPQEPPPPS